MFELIKQGVSLLDVIEKDLGITLKQSGQNFVIDDEEANGGCPWCGHKDCFKVRFDEDDLKGSYAKCFSCDVVADVIGWRALRDKSDMVEAAKKLAVEYGIEIPKSGDYNPLQEVFRLAAHYYHTCLLEDKVSYVELGTKTPMEYQLENRHHQQKTLEDWKVGWSDGHLMDYLEGLGFDIELLNESGLRNVKTGRDFLPARCFIYPHFVKNRVSHMTFKDPTKRLAYQLKKKNSLNGHEFYGQDTVSRAETVILVEGENDLLSVWETRKVPAVIATIGQISGSQLDWLRENFADKNLITIFDNDEAGDKYRIKVEKLRSKFKRLAHVKPPTEKDIDDILADPSIDIEKFILENAIRVEIPKTEKLEPISMPEDPVQAFKERLDSAGLNTPSEPVEKDPEDDVTEEISGVNVIRKGRAYYRCDYKDGEPKWTKISDFVLKLINTFLETKEGVLHRIREVQVLRENGYVSTPFEVNSEATLKVDKFKILVADYADADFSGKEADLASIWKLVRNGKEGREVTILTQAGRDEELGAWIFNDCLIMDSGEIIEKSKEGIFWIKPGKIGVKLRPLMKMSKKNSEEVGCPHLLPSMSKEESEVLLGSVLKNLSKNRHDKGQALTMLGWIYACVHSNLIFKMNRGFPFLFMWGINGKGKTTIARWLQDFFNMRDFGYTSLPQITSQAGLGRTTEYFASMPMIVDEVRVNHKKNMDIMGIFRAFYDRAGRALATKENFGVRTTAVNSTFIFVGEDQFEDPASKERCISMRISPRTDTMDSYLWLESNSASFYNIVFYWIEERLSLTDKMIVDDIRALDKYLVENGCSQRTAKNWAAIGYFGLRLSEKFFPDFDYRKYLVETAIDETRKQKADNSLSLYLEHVEAIQVQPNTRLTSELVMKDAKYLYMWHSAVYKVVKDDQRYLEFSKNAILNSLREEPYFVEEGKKVKMGIDGAWRSVLVFDLEKLPPVLQNIAQSTN
jgi:5S rRNA maturation endonuclease (ribonuclease M5)